MSTRDDLTRATDEAREQVRAARDALAASRTSRAGGAARNVAHAEQQLEALRDAVTTDLRVLRDRISGLDDGERRGASLALIAGVGTVAAVVGTGLAVRRSIRRSLGQRDVQRQARAIAAAMARQAAEAVVEAAGTTSPSGRRRGRGGLLTALIVGAAVAGATAVQQRRTAPVDPDELWLPEREHGAA